MPSANTTNTASNAARERHNEKAPKKGGKAGCQGNFHGMRAQVIDENYPAFLLTRGGPRKTQAKFWNAFFGAWFRMFQWNLPLDRDPDPTFPPPPEETEEILAQKNLIIATTKARLKAHMRYRATAAARKENNPWTGLVNKLFEQTYGTSKNPRKLAPWQLYMSKKSARINELYNERWPTANLGKDDVLNFRGSIAHELLAKEDDEYRAALQQEVDTMHVNDIEKHNAATLPPAAEDDAEKEQARLNFVLVAQPLLELLRQRTGYYLELVAGVPLKTGEKDFDLKVVQAGKAPGQKTWHGVEHTVFSETIMPSFGRFLMTTPEWEERQQHLLGGSGTSRAGSSAPLDVPTAVDSTTGPAPPAQKKNKKTSCKAGKKTAEDDLFETETETETEEEEEEDGDDEEDGSSDDDDEDNEEEGQQGPGLSTSLPDGVTVPSADELGLNEAMVRKLDAMPDDERRLFLWLHRNNTDYEIQCLNTQAANDELLRSLGVDADFLAPKKPVPKKAAKKAAKKTSVQQETTGPGRRSARLSKESTTPSSSSPSPPSASPPVADTGVDEAPVSSGATTSASNTLAPDNVVPAPAPPAATTPCSPQVPAAGATTPSTLRRSPTLPDPTTTPATVSTEPEAPSSGTPPAFHSNPTATHSSGGTVAMEVDFDPQSLTAVKTDGWSDWGKKAFEHFTAKSYSNDFARAVFRWTALEDRFGWEKSTKGYRAQLRPAAIADWMRLDRRVHAKIPKLPPVEEFAASWWVWWLSLQPEWRAMDSAGRPLRNGEGPWDDLVQPGQNGMLLVLLSLVWWYGIAPESLRGDWDAAVRDVAWVLDQMVLAQVEAPSKKRKDDALPTPAAKRARRK